MAYCAAGGVLEPDSSQRFSAASGPGQSLARAVPGGGYEGRLQRVAGPGQTRITRFRQVLARHGLLVLLLSLGSFALPGSFASLEWGTRRFVSAPQPYLVGAGCLFVLLLALSKLSRGAFNPRQVAWLVYLLAVSIGEEWVFRLAIPGFLLSYAALPVAVVASNLVFALIHYFTLRWRLPWVVGAFLGGMGLSNLMRHGDLLLLIALHWFATFLNTRNPPRGTSASRDLTTSSGG